MPKTWTLEDAQAYFAEKGVAWTPAAEKELRDRGMLVGGDQPPPGRGPEAQDDPGPTTWPGRAPDSDPRFASPGAIPVNKPLTHDPYAVSPGGEITGDIDAPSSLGMNALRGYLSAASAGNLGIAGDEDPEKWYSKVAESVGTAGGLAQTFMAMQPALSPLGGYLLRGMSGTKYAEPAFKIAGKGVSLADVIASSATGSLGLGAYSAAAPAETAMDRADNFAHGANLGAGLGLMGGVPVVGKAMAHPFLKYPAGGAIMTGLGVASGKSVEDALLEDAPLGLTLPALHAIGKPKATPPRLSRTPAEMEVPKSETPKSGGKFQYIEGEPRSKPVVDYLNDKIPLEEMTAQYRESGLRKQSEQFTDFIEADGIKDIGANQTVGRHRRVREMGGNVFNSPLSKATVRQWELWDQAKHKMEGEAKADFLNVLEKSGFKEKDPDFGILGNYMRAFEKNPLDAEALLASAENPGRIKEAAPRLRAELERIWRVQNDMELAAGNDAGFPHKEGYWPHINKSYGMGNPLGAIRQRTEPISPKSMDPDPKARAFTSREMEQTLAVKDAELDPFVFMDRVIRDMGRKVAHTATISIGQSAADAIDVSGKAARTARGLRTITEASYNNKRYGWAGTEINSMQAHRSGQAALAVARFTKQRFNTAKYTLAVPFVTLRQWGSLGLLNAHGEITPKMWAEALVRSAAPKSGEKYRDSYTGWVKNLEYGHLSREGATGDVTSAGSLRPKTGVKKIPEAIKAGSEWLVNRNENWTGRVSVEMADIIAEKIKMPESDRAAHRSEVAGLTQSYYDAVNRAEVSNAPGLNLGFPAQSFGLEGYNSVYRDIITNETLTGAQKAKRVGGLLSFIYLQRLLQEYVTSYKDDPKDMAADAAKGAATSLVPYVPQMLGLGAIGKGRLYPATAVEDFFGSDKKMGVVGYLKDGDFTSALGELGKNWLRFGAQADRAIDTDRRIKEGKLTEADRLKGSLFGWYTTESGKEGLRDLLDYDKEPDTPAWKPPKKSRRSSRRGSSRGRRGQ